MIHHKNLTYFLNNAKKAKLQATRELGTGEKYQYCKNTVVDIGTTSELGFGKRRLSHVLGMYGTIIFWVSSAMLVFCYTGTADKSSSTIMVNVMACWSNFNLFRWILVLVFFKSRCIQLKPILGIELLKQIYLY